MSDPVVVGDVAVCEGADGRVVIRSGSRWRTKITVFRRDRLAVAAAVAGEGYDVVKREGIDILRWAILDSLGNPRADVNAQSRILVDPTDVQAWADALVDLRTGVAPPVDPS